MTPLRTGTGLLVQEVAAALPLLPLAVLPALMALVVVPTATFARLANVARSTDGVTLAVRIAALDVNRPSAPVPAPMVEVEMMGAVVEVAEAMEAVEAPSAPTTRVVVPTATSVPHLRPVARSGDGAEARVNTALTAARGHLALAGKSSLPMSLSSGIPSSFSCPMYWFSIFCIVRIYFRHPL